MAINLVKGQKVDLTKGNAGLKNLLVGLGWDVFSRDGERFDLDTSAFLLNDDNKAVDYVYFNQQKSANGAIVLSGDNLTGEGSGDDETLTVSLEKVPNNVEQIAISVNIYEADSRRQNFGMVNNAYVRIIDKDTNKELCKYDLDEDYSIETGIIFGRIYRHNGEWKFAAVGDGYVGGLRTICDRYGI